MQAVKPDAAGSAAVCAKSFCPTWKPGVVSVTLRAMSPWVTPSPPATP
jgi:hypothetical protein